MSTIGEDVLKQALALPIAERAELVEHLLTSFQEPIDSRIEELWVEEAHDRLEAYDRGEIEALSAEEVIKNSSLLIKK